MKTIRIVSEHPESQGDFVVINEDEFDAEKHTLFDVPPADPVVARGPRGKFYLKVGKDAVGGPFDTEEEAKAALADLPK